LLGATVVIVSDLNAERLAQARSFGCETVDVSQDGVAEQIEQILGEPEVDAAVDAVHAVGFEARGNGPGGPVAPATVLNFADGVHARGAVLSASPAVRHGRPRRDRRRRQVRHAARARTHRQGGRRGRDRDQARAEPAWALNGIRTL
jgi:threonine dehydrogenase-like Zn-dependent dehydrogenase